MVYKLGGCHGDEHSLDTWQDSLLSAYFEVVQYSYKTVSHSTAILSLAKQ
jgi:hypothetical protein